MAPQATQTPPAVRRSARASTLIPLALAAGYLVLLIIRFPHLIGWENADSDIASAYTLTDAISLGHTGEVVMSTQGSWVPLWYGLLTHGLPFHRLLWELSPALLSLASAGLISWSVARVSSVRGGVLTVALIVAASPTALLIFSAAFFHNTTVPGVAILGAYLVWLNHRGPTRALLVVSILLISLVIGAFVASDELLVVVGLLPFVAVTVVLSARTRDPTGLLPVVAVACGSAIVALATSHLMRSMDFRTTTPSLRLTRTLLGSHMEWLAQGLLRMGNGLSVAPHSPLRAPLFLAAGIVTVAALGGMLWLACRSVLLPVTGARDRARSLHAMFWAASVVCAALAYVVTSAATEPSDRYFIVAVPAVAATVPLLLTNRRANWLVATGATVFIAASIVGLAANDERYLAHGASDVAQAGRIEALVHAQHLTVGYAGYWDAASLSWTTHGRLRVYPVTDVYGATEPMFLARIAAWYRPRLHTPTYLLLAPGDDDLADALPRDLPSPQHEFHLGPVTMAVYSYDIAWRLHAPIN